MVQFCKANSATLFKQRIFTSDNSRVVLVSDWSNAEDVPLEGTAVPVFPDYRFVLFCKDNIRVNIVSSVGSASVRHFRAAGEGGVSPALRDAHSGMRFNEHTLSIYLSEEPEPRSHLIFLHVWL